MAEPEPAHRSTIAKSTAAPPLRDFHIEDHAFEGEAMFPDSGEMRIWSYLAPVVGEVSIGARRHPRRVYHPGDLRVTPPETAIRRAADGAAVIRSFAISRRVLEEALGAPAEEVFAGFTRRLQHRAFRAPIVWSVAERLRSAEGDEATDSAYVDAMLHAAAHELWRLSGGSAANASGSFSAAELRRLNQFIDSQLDAKLQLRDLAAALSMPLLAFKTAIKRTTGRTAYQHLMHRRLAAARRLLETSQASLAQIAFRTGFSSQSHMTDVFKTKLGATPGVLRSAAAARR